MVNVLSKTTQTINDRMGAPDVPSKMYLTKYFELYGEYNYKQNQKLARIMNKIKGD